MYLTQRGVAEWDATLSYPKTAIVQWNGVIYVSNKETKGEQPDKSQAAWSTLGVFLGLGNYYTKTDTDTKFQLKGNYALKGKATLKLNRILDSNLKVITSRQATVIQNQSLILSINQRGIMPQREIMRQIRR